MDNSHVKILRCLIDNGDGDNNKSAFSLIKLGLKADLFKDYKTLSSGSKKLVDNNTSKLFTLLHAWFTQNKNKMSLSQLDSNARKMDIPIGDVENIVLQLSVEPVPNEAELKEAIVRCKQNQGIEHIGLTIDQVNNALKAGVSPGKVYQLLTSAAGEYARDGHVGVGETFRGTMTYDQLLKDYLDNYNNKNISGERTGIPHIDESLKSGLTPGSLTLLVGEEYTGKTALLMYILLNIYNEGKNVFLASTEQDPQFELIYRLIANRTGIDVDSAEFKNLQSHEFERIKNECTIQAENENKFYISPPEEALEFGLLSTRLKNLASEVKLSAIGVDFVSLIDIGDYMDVSSLRSDQKILSVVTELRRIAASAQCPLIVVHTLTARERKERDKPIENQDLAECKALRYVATNIIGIRNVGYNQVEINITKGKNRGIQNPVDKIVFDFAHMKIGDKSVSGVYSGGI